MDDKRLDEIRARVSSPRYDCGIMRPALAELIDDHDSQAARIAELEGEVRRLTQCDTNMMFLLDCLEKAELLLPDYTLGTWQDRAKGLAPSISRIVSRLSTLARLAGAVVESKQPVLVDNGRGFASDGEPLMDETGDYYVDGGHIDALSAALPVTSEGSRDKMRKMADLEDAAGGISVGGLAVDTGMPLQASVTSEGKEGKEGNNGNSKH